METLTIIEHQSIPVLAKRERGAAALSQTQALFLERLEKRLPQRTFSWGHQCVKFAHYCGVITLGDITLEILPKIYGLETEYGASREALIKMLYQARRLKPQPGGMAELSLQKHHLLDIFIRFFCELLHTELMQGMIREYLTQQENLPVLRGRLRIEQQMKHNLAHRERLFCQYDEFSADNAHNRILKYVLSLRLAIGDQARKQVTELLMRFEAISDIRAEVSDLDQLVFDRATNRYKPVFEQCRWFLQSIHPDVVAGGTPSLALLFDMNRLFEAYVASQLRKAIWAKGLQLREQGPQKYLIRREADNAPLFMMKPDMAILDDGRVIAIADAKWKLLDDSERKMGISQADLYQMASYASRYGVARLALIYPRQKDLLNPINLQIHGVNAVLTILPVEVADQSTGTPLRTWLSVGLSHIGQP